MGLFDLFKKSQTVEFSNNAEAILALMLAIGSIDGELDRDEVMALVGIAQLNRSLAGSDLQRAVDSALRYLKNKGPGQTAVDALGFLPAELHATAFAFASLVAMADGVVTEEEEQKLMELAEQSSLDEETARAVVRVATALMARV
ncbi:MAG: tellurite resistance TerB family protein [Hydrogenophilus sp.]|nr:tellurite resistance TerB family protein [Hydrogenophilus sp.]